MTSLGDVKKKKNAYIKKIIKLGYGHLKTFFTSRSNKNDKTFLSTQSRRFLGILIRQLKLVQFLDPNKAIQLSERGRSFLGISRSQL